MAIRMNTVKLLCMHITHTIMIVYNVLSNGDLYGGREEPPVATLESLQWECEIHCRNTNSTAEMQNSEESLLNNSAAVMQKFSLCHFTITHDLHGSIGFYT